MSITGSDRKRFFLVIPLAVVSCLIHIATSTHATEPVNFEIITTNVEGRVPQIIIKLSTAANTKEEFKLRFPELISFRAEGDTQRMYQYVDNVYRPSSKARLECPFPPKRLPPPWRHSGNQDSYVMEFTNGVSFQASVERHTDGFDITYELINNSDKKLHDISVWSCLILSGAPSFRNLFMDQTYVHTADGFQCFGDLADPKKFPRDKKFRFTGAGHRRARDLEGWINPKVEPHWAYESLSVYRWRVPKPIDLPILAETSNDGRIVVATASKHAHTVWSNAYINCQHSDPSVGDCDIGETVSTFQRVYLYRGGLESLVDLYQRDFGEPGKVN